MLQREAQGWPQWPMWTWVHKGLVVGCSANVVWHVMRWARVCVRAWVMVMTDGCGGARVRWRTWLWIATAAWPLLHRPRLPMLLSTVALAGARRACRWWRRWRRCVHLLQYKRERV